MAAIARGIDAFPPATREELAGLTKEQLIELVLHRSASAAADGSDAMARADQSQVQPSEVGQAAAHSTENVGRRHRKQRQEKPSRAFDMSKYAQRCVALRVAYVGTRYSGMAWQADIDETVEGRLLEALMKTRLITSREDCDFSRGGRTDKGVSALGQVVALRVRSSLSREQLVKSSQPHARVDVGGGPVQGPDHSTSTAVADSEESAGALVAREAARESPGTSTVVRGSPSPFEAQLPEAAAVVAAHATEMDYARVLNNVLPHDIRVLAWMPVPPHFSARFSATQRTYKYFFVRRDLDLAAMRRGCQLLLGEHDFRNFCKIDPTVTNFCRRVYSFDLQLVEGFPGSADDAPSALWEFVVCGSAFLYHQVRCMVAVLFLIGERKEQPEVINSLLDITATPARPLYDLAPEGPLLLFDIGYKDAQWVHSPANLEAFAQLWATRTEELLLQASTMHTMRKYTLGALVPRPALQESGMCNDTPSRPRESSPTSTCIDPACKWSEAAEGNPPQRRTMKTHVPLLQRMTATSVEEQAAIHVKKRKRREHQQQQSGGRGGGDAAV